MEIRQSLLIFPGKCLDWAYMRTTIHITCLSWDQSCSMPPESADVRQLTLCGMSFNTYMELRGHRCVWHPKSRHYHVDSLSYATCDVCILMCFSDLGEGN